MRVNLKNLKKISFRSIFWLLFYIFIFTLCLHNSSSYLDPDFGWHLKMGEEIITTQSVPHINTINYTLAGERWVDHEWLAESFLYQANKTFGYTGVEIIFSLLIVLIFVILNHFIARRFSQNKNDLYLIMPFEIFGLMSILPSAGVRLQEIGLLFFLLLLLIIYRYEQNKKYQTLLWLLPLLYLWSCLHGTFLIAFFILALFGGAKIIEAILYQKWPDLFFGYADVFNKKQIITLAAFSLGPFSLTFLTPYGSKLYSFLIGYSNTYYLTAISEWLPQWFFPYNYQQLFYISFVAATIILSVYSSLSKRRKINLPELIMLFVFTILALKSRRHTQLLVIISLPFIFNFCRDFLEITIPEQKNKPSSISNKLSQLFVITVLLVTIGGKLILNQPIAEPFKQFCGDYPCAAIEYLKSNPQYNEDRIYNAYAWGGFMIWTYPTKQLFIDGRMPQIAYEKYTILQEYKSFYDPAQVAEKISKHNIKLFLLSSQGEKIRLNWAEKYIFRLDEAKINSQPDALKEYLNNNSAWKIIYSDNISVIYAKK